MPLTTGSRLGPYEIVSPLGAGGMGEVYRGRDTRLGRDVAIKVLHGHMAGDVGFRERFEREARAVARLNHPNILALHDVGETDGLQFIVTELVDGEPVTGPLPLRKLLDVATQIAGGLAVAHEAGVVHRDIKPDNLLIGRDGRVKILDFGLASEQPAIDDGPGVTRAVTSAGTVLGTVAYMSPEQARGVAADARSDQFAFGLVLYELASGRRAFTRDSAVQTLSAIIESDPDLVPLAALPVHVRWIIERCLAKDPADRYASTADLYRDLRHLRDRQSEIGQSGVQDIVAAPARRRRLVPVVAAIVSLGVIAAATLIWLQRDRGVSLDAYRFIPFAVDAGVQSMPAWSPDGQGLAFSGEVDGYYQIFTRRLDQSTASQVTRLPGDCVYPVWDPDGTRVFFQLAQRGNQGFVASANEVWVVSAAGGAPERLLGGAPAFAIAPDGSQLVFLAPASGQNDGTYVVRAFDLRQRTTRELAQIPGRWPGGYTPASPGFKFSPDGSMLALTGQGTADMIVLSNPLAAGGGAVRTVRFAPAAGGALSLYEFAWAPDGRHVVIVLRDGLGGDQSLWTGDMERGTATRLTASFQWESTPAVSPDGGRIAYGSTPLDWDLLEIDLAGGATRPVIASARYDGWGDWMPDGSGVVFSTQRTGRFEIWAQAFRDGIARAVVTPDAFRDEASLFLVQGAVSPDGRSLAYVRFTPSGTRIYVSAMAGSRPVRLTSDAGSGGREDGPRWSADGRWILFRRGNVVMKALASGGTDPAPLASDGLGISKTSDSGSAQWMPDGTIVYAAADGLRQISGEGGPSRLVTADQPMIWNLSPDGRAIYAFMEREQRMIDLVTIDVATGASRTLQSLGRKPLTPDYNGYWDTVRALRVSPDGKRLMYARLNPTSDIWILDVRARAPGL